MEKIWEKWKEHYKSLGIDPANICKDGIIDEHVYDKAEPRILFMMKEVNRFPGGDLRVLLKERPWRTLSIWTAGILNNFPKYEELVKMDAGSLREYSAKYGIVNLKKISGRETADTTVINAYAHQDRRLLREQIELIRPEFMISCGVNDSLVWLLDLNITPENMFRGPVKNEKRSAWVIPLRHPSRDLNSKQTYEKLKAMVKTTKEYLPNQKT